MSLLRQQGTKEEQLPACHASPGKRECHILKKRYSIWSRPGICSSKTKMRLRNTQKTKKAGMAQWWEHCGVSLFLVLFSAPRGFSPSAPVFQSPQNQHFQIPIRSGMHWHLWKSSLELFGVPWVNKKYYIFYIFVFTCLALYPWPFYGTSPPTPPPQQTVFFSCILLDSSFLTKTNLCLIRVYDWCSWVSYCVGKFAEEDGFCW